MSEHDRQTDRRTGHGYIDFSRQTEQEYIILTGSQMFPSACYRHSRVGDDYRIRTHLELYEIFNDMNVAKRINIQRFRLVGHVVRMDEAAPQKRVFDAVIGGHRRQVRPRTRW